MKIRRRSIMASESDGNYDSSFKKNGTTYYIEMLSDGGNYVAKWWDSSDNGLGYNNKGWVAIEGKNYRALSNIGDVNSDNVVGLLSVISDYDRKPGKPIQDRIKREVAKLVDFGSINSGCTKKSVKSNKINKRRAIKSNHKAPRRYSKIMAGPGAGYTIEWELDSIRKINSFDVVDVSKPDEWGTVTVTADCDVDIDVTIKSAWSYMYGFNHPIEGVSAKIHRVVFDYNISDNYGDLLNFEDYEDLTEDSEYIDEVMNAVYQINEMEAMNILENEAWETIKGDEFTYGGGYMHSTWDGTILEVDKNGFADIQVTDQMVIDYVDAAVTDENLYVEYKIDSADFRDAYFATEEEARNAAIEAIQSGEIVDEDLTIIKTEWHEILLNTMGETDLDDPYDEEVDTIYYDDYAPEIEDEE